MKQYRVAYSDEAQQHLRDIFRIVAEAASSQIAQDYIDEIVAQCERLSTFPARGAPRRGSRSGMRSFVVRRNAMIAYLIEEDTVRILGVFRRGQDFDAALVDL